MRPPNGPVLCNTAATSLVLAVTVNVVFPEILPEVAVMVVEPAAIEVASPALLMVVTPVFEELHVTDDVISFVVLSE
jgi:hypothetical protein